MTFNLENQRVVTALQSAFLAGKLASSHIFWSSQESEQELAALEMVRFILCQHSGNAKEERPCGQCKSCLSFQRQGDSQEVKSFGPDGLWLEPEGTQYKLETLRSIHDFLSLRSWNEQRCIVLKKAEALGVLGSNLILKILEEPPPKVYFFLVTSQLSSLLPTIRSRCQWHRFQTHGHRGTTAGVEMDELKAIAIGAWKYSPAEGYEHQELLSHFKNKSKALAIVKFWMELWRDVQMHEVGAHHLTLHKDQAVQIEDLANRFPRRASEIFMELLRLEKDVRGNSDLDLLSDSFFANLSSV